MKSIQDWQTEKLAEELNMSPQAAKMFMGSSTIKVDPKLKSNLRSKLQQLRQLPEYASASDEEFFKAVVGAAWSIIGDVKGSQFGVGSGVRSFGDDLGDNNEI
jgi:hypothetical protein